MKRKRIEFISLEEFNQLMKATDDKELRLAMVLGFGSGLRISEIIGLRKFESKCCKAQVRQEGVEDEN